MFSMSHLILEPNWWLMWAKSWPFSQCCFSNVRGLFLKKIIVSIACCTANLKLVSLGKSQKFFPPNFQRRNNQGPKGGGVPGALEPWNFCGGARSPIILLTWALILFRLWTPEPKDTNGKQRTVRALATTNCARWVSKQIKTNTVKT